MEEDMEESIDSSPYKASSSFHQTRMRRRDERKRLEATIRTINVGGEKEEQPQRPQLTLAAMYWENDDQDHRKATINLALNFDPFKDQKLLASVDRITSTRQQYKRQSNLTVAATVGFQKCEDLVVQDEVHDEYEISDADLMQICKQAEEAQKLAECQETTPQKTKSIVDLILEDFCCSPFTPPFKLNRTRFTYSQRENDAKQAEEAQKLTEYEETTPPQSQKTKSIVDLILEDFGCSPFTPPFKLNRTRRTYSWSKKHAKDSFAEQLERVAMTIAPSQPPQIDNDDNLSICSSLSIQEDRTQSPPPRPVAYFSQKNNSLLNLSAYFKQHHSVENQNQTETLKTGLGLEEEEKEECLEIAPKNVVLTKTHDEILTLRQKYPVSFRRRRSSSSDEFYGFPDENGDGVNNKTSDLRAGNAGQLSQTSKNSETKMPPAQSSSPTVKPGDLIKQCDSKLSDTKSRIIHNDESLFSDDEDDFFVNFKTQDSLKAAASKKLHVPTTNVPSSSATASTKLNAMHLKNLSVLEGFQTAGFKKIYISAAAQARAAQLQQDLPELPVKKGEKFEGFQTASRKTIEISEEAKKRAATILADVPELENFDFLVDDQPCTSKSASLKQAAQNAALRTKTKLQLNVPSSDLGVQSKTEQQRCLGILLKDFDMPVKNPMPQFEGFRSASRKTIQKSDEAKIKASRILIDLSEIPQKQEKPVPAAIDQITKAEIEATVVIAKEFQDNNFSKWPRTDASETQKTAVAAVKRKLTNDEIGLMNQSSKLLCKSNSSSLQQQRSPLNCTENASELRRSPSKSATISRRNLLSLSKLKKNRPTSLGSSGSGSVGPSPNVETPSKSNTNNRSNQQTPDTPNVHEFFDLLSTNTSTPARPPSKKGVALNSLRTAMALKLVEDLPPHRFEANSKTVVHSKSVGAATCANTPASRILIDLPEIPQKLKKPVPAAIDEITKAKIEATVNFSKWPRTDASETQKTAVAAVKRKLTNDEIGLMNQRTSTPARPPSIKGVALNSLKLALAFKLVQDLPPHRFEANSKSVVHSKSVGAATCANTSGGSSSNLSLNASANGKPTAQERMVRLRMYDKPPALPRENNNCRPSGLSRSAAGRGLSLNKSKK